MSINFGEYNSITENENDLVWFNANTHCNGFHNNTLLSGFAVSQEMGFDCI